MYKKEIVWVYVCVYIQDRNLILLFTMKSMPETTFDMHTKELLMYKEHKNVAMYPKLVHALAGI